MRTTAATYRRADPVRRQIRKFKDGTATQAIGELAPGCDIFVLTFGQFSLIDALCAIVAQTGPAHVTLSTWTAAHADLERAETLVSTAKIRNMRWIVDRSFEQRMPHYCRAMRKLFGHDCIRGIKSHAKWAIIRNEQWNIVMRTSMNMNHNPRLENLEISDDAAFAEFFQSIADEIFATVPANEFGIEEIPAMAAVDWDQPGGQATAGKLDFGDLAQASPGPTAAKVL
jgi:hypothetical protein